MGTKIHCIINPCHRKKSINKYITILIAIYCTSALLVFPCLTPPPVPKLRPLLPFNLNTPFQNFHLEASVYHFTCYVRNTSTTLHHYECVSSPSLYLNKFKTYSFQVISTSYRSPGMCPSELNIEGGKTSMLKGKNIYRYR